jgi:XRE family transcriptional regulator, regulator of sulfur utilization
MLFLFLLWLLCVAAKQEYRKIVGKTIRRYRNRAGMSIERLAERADLHHNYVGEVERGEKGASLDTLMKLAKGLNVRPHRLLLKL